MARHQAGCPGFAVGDRGSCDAAGSPKNARNQRMPSLHWINWRSHGFRVRLSSRSNSLAEFLQVRPEAAVPGKSINPSE